jgi:putative FmdB family regulatory protein
MPTYDYRCTKCGEQFEVFQSITEDPLKKHPGCGGKVNKVFAPVGIVLKGSGFYRTDNRSSGGKGAKPKSESTSESTSSSSDSGSKSDSSSSSKSDAKTKTESKKSA